MLIHTPLTPLALRLLLARSVLALSLMALLITVATSPASCQDDEKGITILYVQGALQGATDTGQSELVDRQCLITEKEILAIMEQQARLGRYVMVITPEAPENGDRGNAIVYQRGQEPQWLLARSSWNGTVGWTTDFGNPISKLNRMTNSAIKGSPPTIQSSARVARALYVALHDYITMRSSSPDRKRVVPVSIIFLLRDPLSSRLVQGAAHFIAEQHPICRTPPDIAYSDTVDILQEVIKFSQNPEGHSDHAFDIAIDLNFGVIDSQQHTWVSGDIYNLAASMGFADSIVRRQVRTIDQFDPFNLSTNPGDRSFPLREIRRFSPRELDRFDRADCQSDQWAMARLGCSRKACSAASDSISNHFWTTPTAEAPSSTAYVTVPQQPQTRPASPLPPLPPQPPLSRASPPVGKTPSGSLPPRISVTIEDTSPRTSASTMKLSIMASATNADAKLLLLPEGASEDEIRRRSVDAGSKLTIAKTGRIEPGPHDVVLLVEPTQACRDRQSYSVELSYAGSLLETGTSRAVNFGETDGDCTTARFVLMRLPDGK